MRTVLCFDDQADTLVIRSYFGKPKATRSRRGKGRRRLALARRSGVDAVVLNYCKRR